VIFSKASSMSRSVPGSRSAVVRAAVVWARNRTTMPFFQALWVRMRFISPVMSSICFAFEVVTVRTISLQHVCVEIAEDIPGVNLGINLRIDFGDISFRINQKSGPFGEDYPIRSISLNDFFLGILKERKREVKFGSKVRVTVLALAAYPNYLHSFLKLTVVVAKLAGLLYASGCVVLRIEVEEEPLAFILGERMNFSVLVMGRKVRSPTERLLFHPDHLL